MKQLLLLIGILCLNGCSGGTSSTNKEAVDKQEKKEIAEAIETKAKRQMKATINELAKNPSSISMYNMKQEHKSDSIYIISFTMRGQNGFGGYSISKNEYIYAILNIGKFEALLDLEEHPTVMDMVVENFNKFEKMGRNPDFEKCYKDVVSLIVLTYGRRIKNSEEKEIDLSFEWGK